MSYRQLKENEMSMLIRCGVVVTLVSFVMFGCAGPGKPEAGPCDKAKKVAPCEKAKKAAAPEPRPTEAEKGMPFGVVWRVDKAPVVDGVIKQDEWGKPLAGQLADNASGKAVAWATTVWLAYDKDNLYLAFRLDEPEMDELICMVTERDGDLKECTSFSDIVSYNQFPLSFDFEEGDQFDSFKMHFPK